MQEKVRLEVEERILESLTGDTSSREAFRRHLRAGLLEQQTVTVDVPVKEHEQPSSSNAMQADLISSIKKLVHGKKYTKKDMLVSEARPLLEVI